MAENRDHLLNALRERLRSYAARYSSSQSEDVPPPRTIAIVVCVILAAILWLTLTMQETYTILVPLETRVLNLPPDQALEDSLPQTIRAVLTGARIQLLRTAWDPPPVAIDVTQEAVDVEEAVSLNNVRVQSVSPTVIQPRLGPRMTRRLPIRLMAQIGMAEGHDFLLPPTIVPDSVAVTGAERIVQRLTHWPTRPLTYSGLKDTFMARVELADTLRRLVTFRPREVLLTAVAGEFIGGFREIDVHVQGVPAGEVVVDPPTLRVRYTVLFSDYELAQHAPDFYAEVTYDQIRQDRSGRVAPRLHTPTDLQIRNVEAFPATVSYYQRLERR